jgi:hypothetical protein
MGLEFRLAVGVGIGFLGVLSLFGCAATAPLSGDLATSRVIAVPRALKPASGDATTEAEGNPLTVAAAEIDPYKQDAALEGVP